MRWSVRLARVAGIEVRLHLTFLLLLAWLGLTFLAQAGPAGAARGLGYVLGLFGSVLLHEFGHAMAARRFGIRTPDITLLPIGGVARLERMPDDPREELVVAVAGPAVNVAIAGALAVGLSSAGVPLVPERFTLAGGNLLVGLMWGNLFLVGFNVLPAFPMDGGRVLRAVLATRMDYVAATQIAASIGQGMAFVFGFLGLFTNPLLLFIALFVYLGAASEGSLAQMRTATAEVPVRSAMVTDFQPLDADAPLAEAVGYILRTAQRVFPVVAAEGGVVGVLTREDIIKGLSAGGPYTRVAEAMQAGVPVVRAEDMLHQAFVRMQQCGCPALPVVDRRGAVVGMVTTDSVGELVMIHAVLARGEQPAWRRPWS